MKGRREFLLISWAFLTPIASYAQSVGRVRVIGVLGNATQSDNAGDPMRLFIAALRDLGWSEGKTVSFEYRGAEQRYERFPASIFTEDQTAVGAPAEF